MIFRVCICPNDPRPNKMISSESLFRFLIVDHGVGESAYVAGSDPHVRVHNDGGVEADHVEVVAVGAFGGAADDVVPPGFLEVAFEFDAEWAVIPEAVDAAVDFGGLEDEAAAFAEGDDLLHFGGWGGGFGGLGLVGHGDTPVE